MIRSILLFLTLFGLLLGGDIVWQKDLKSAFSLAQEQHRTLMVMVEGEHCRWCKKMHARTLNDEKIIEALTPYVCVRVDENDQKAMDMLPWIEGIPTIFFMYPDRKIIETVTGYYNREDFLSFIRDVKQKTWQHK